MLETDDGRYVHESNAILWYLADGTPFLPDDGFQRAHVLKWLILEQTDVMMGIGGLRFRLLTKRWTPDDSAAVARRELGLGALRMLEEHLTSRTFFVGDRYSIADIAIYAYTHVAPDAGFTFDDFPAVRSWLARVEAEPRYVNDLVPYPPNAEPGKSRSIYD